MGAKGPFHGFFFADASLKRISDMNALNFPDGTASHSGDWFNDYSRDVNISENLTILISKLGEFSEPKSVVIGDDRQLLQIIVSTVQLSQDGKS
jgi:hypothetical protein